MCDRCRLWHHVIVLFAERQRFSRLSRSMVATLSFAFAAILALLVCGRQCVDRWMDGEDWWGQANSVIRRNDTKLRFGR
ncbi:hypothetical protein BLNAU_18573 [Blattamonas nauphoetae]|uniref:Uncharacterized protein n=1 Tax=Blattamonas nauphoetae TaxID=2049346 RepID=A0ABQ9X425_9EUKA|nr:hypothetical protein BLNAU_18573 [Blattamonas nauphoetae]